jgi:hypothetical protein
MCFRKSYHITQKNQCYIQAKDELLELATEAQTWKGIYVFFIPYTTTMKQEFWERSQNTSICNLASIKFKDPIHNLITILPYIAQKTLQNLEC